MGGDGILKKLKHNDPKKSIVKTLNGERLLNIKKILGDDQSKSDTHQCPKFKLTPKLDY